MIINQLLPIDKQYPVFIQKVQEHGSCNSLISVKEAVVLSDEIQQMRRLFFQRRVYILPTKGLIDIPDTSLKRVIFLPSKQIRFSAKPHMRNDFYTFFVI